MSEIIHEMAQIQLPKELLQQVDLDNLFENFRTNFKKLDEFKNVRDKHNNRDFFKKFVDGMTGDNTLESAQFDAVEVQAEFSKAIGQLMVLSIMQSQYLDRQQQQLSAQQITIKAQTSSIEQHNTILEEQHKHLAKQNVELEKWVKEFLALKGLTEKDAKKLIEIAQEVKNTRDQLLQSVENSLSGALRQIGITKEQIKAELVNAMELISYTISAAQAEIDKKLSAQLDEVGSQLVSSNEKVSSLQDDLKHSQADSVKQHEQVAAALVSLGSKFGVQLDTVSVGMNTKLDAITKQFAAHQSNTQLKFRRLQMMLAASLVFSIGLLGFILFRS